MGLGKAAPDHFYPSSSYLLHALMKHSDQRLLLLFYLHECKLKGKGERVAQISLFDGSRSPSSQNPARSPNRRLCGDPNISDGLLHPHKAGEDLPKCRSGAQGACRRTCGQSCKGSERESMSMNSKQLSFRVFWLTKHPWTLSFKFSIE